VQTFHAAPHSWNVHYCESVCRRRQVARSLEETFGEFNVQGALGLAERVIKGGVVYDPKALIDSIR
jgi:hypothetical protein